LQVQPSLPLGHSRGAYIINTFFFHFSANKNRNEIRHDFTGSTLATARETFISCAKIEKAQENNNIIPVEYVDSKI
ncbi:hypothetical protein, partial [Blautia argi]|uniref:hypothetical protein n=1 Tax=Blautia argi TaxID=1912897 RepID=UPI002942AEAF